MWWLRITLNIKLNLIGKENIPNKAGVIISNHQSTWETLALQAIFPHQTWVLKQELQWIPIFGWGLSLLKPIIIDRGEKLKALKKVIRQGAARIAEGIFVVVFPEGTRQPYGQLGEYQKGGVCQKNRLRYLTGVSQCWQTLAKRQFCQTAGNHYCSNRKANYRGWKNSSRTH